MSAAPTEYDRRSSIASEGDSGRDRQIGRGWLAVEGAALAASASEHASELDASELDDSLDDCWATTGVLRIHTPCWLEVEGSNLSSAPTWARNDRLIDQFE